MCRCVWKLRDKLSACSYGRQMNWLNMFFLHQWHLICTCLAVNPPDKVKEHSWIWPRDVETLLPLFEGWIFFPLLQWRPSAMRHKLFSFLNERLFSLTSSFPEAVTGYCWSANRPDVDIIYSAAQPKE